MPTEAQQLQNDLLDLHRSNINEMKAALAKLENTLSYQEKKIESIDRTSWKIQNYGYSFVGLALIASGLFGYNTWQSIPNEVKTAIEGTVQISALNDLTEKLRGVDVEATTILARLRANERFQVVSLGPIVACSGPQEILLPEGENTGDFELLVVPTDMHAGVEARQNGDNAIYGSSVFTSPNLSNTGWTVEYKLIVTIGHNAGFAKCGNDTANRFGKASIFALRR